MTDVASLIQDTCDVALICMLNGTYRARALHPDTMADLFRTLFDALEESERESQRLRLEAIRKDRKIASQERQIQRLWRLVNDTERGIQ